MIVPASFNFPHTGKLVSLSFVLFAGWFADAPVPLAAYPQLALTGLLTFFGSLNVAVPFLLDMFRIPADTFQLFLATGVINSRFGSLLAAVHTVTIALVGTAAVVGAVRLVPARLVRYAVITVLLTAATLGGLRLAFEVLLSGEFKGREMIYGLKPRFDHPATVVLQEPLPPAVDRGPGSTIARIRSRGRLEVAVAERGLPYAFRNDSRELVGLDVEMAHRLARDLGVGIEFVQSRIDELPRLLRDGQCDIAMSGIAVTPRRAEAMRFSLAYLDETLGFMVLDHLQGRFTTWDAIRQQGGITIGAVNAPYYLDEVRDRAPQVRFEDISAVVDPIANGSTLEAFLVPAERGSVWTLLHPQFTVVVPQPDPVKVPLAYGLPPNDSDWASLVNNWIELKRRDGTIAALFRHWIMGESQERERRRWSVVRNVLHWVN